MRIGQSIKDKIVTLPELNKRMAQWRLLGKTIVFTNGCFDVLHLGHISTLMEAAKHAHILIVGLNSDASVKKLKGDDRPVNDEQTRALLLASLAMVDGVVIFTEETPRELIMAIQPDLLVKGGDYKVEEIAGAKEVIESGGKVVLTPIAEGVSSTSLIEKLKAIFKE
ncbi:MAG: D-glycero-beta-D-manno-heptose 1-phosphate adenylyltransferase [Chitinophagaceae bacterium]